MSLIDVLCLHHPKDTEKSSVRALGGTKLNSIMEQMIEQIARHRQIPRKSIAVESMQVNPNSLNNWCGHNPKYPEGHPIPLWALGKCLDQFVGKRETHVDIIRSITDLQCGRVAKTVKAVTELTPEVVQLCGAHAADGSLYLQHNRGPISSTWELGDQEETNVRAVQKWIAKLFGIELSILKKGSIYLLRTDTQVIPRYLIRIFDFPVGEKSHIVEEPRILSDPNDSRLLVAGSERKRWSLRLLFAKEVVNFDGHSTRTGGLPSVGLGSQSDKMRRSLTEIFGHFGVEFKNYDSHKVMLTTSRENSRRLYSLGLFRGNKRSKLKRLLSR